MNSPIIAFLNAQAGVGTTSLVYHLAWMYQGLGLRVLAIDLDPHATLTTMLLEDDRLLELWETGNQYNTIAQCLKSWATEKSGHADPLLENIADDFDLFSGDLDLAAFEYDLSLVPRNSDGDCFFAVLLKSLISGAVEKSQADVVLLDLGANCGVVNHSALMVADYYITPVTLSISSLYGAKSIESAIGYWRQQRQPAKAPSLSSIKSLGYVVQQHTVSVERLASNYSLWQLQVAQIDWDSNLLNPCLAVLKRHHSLMPMAVAARKPMFQLKPADGATGAYSKAVRTASEDFRQLAQKIAELTQIGNWPTEANYSHEYSGDYINPPADLPLYILERETLLFRIHRNNQGALYFNRNNGSRFSASDGKYGVLYAGLDSSVCFLEIFGSQPYKSRVIDAESLQSMGLSQFFLQRDLRLVDLSGAGLALIGADSRVLTGSYQLSQAWSEALYQHAAKIDGIYYRSRHDPSKFLVALYENRVTPIDLQEQRITPLLDPSFASVLQRILDAYGYQLVDDSD
jgi:chromosome partitioning protein